MNESEESELTVAELDEMIVQARLYLADLERRRLAQIVKERRG